MPSTPQARSHDHSRGILSLTPATLIVVCAIALTFLGLTVLFSASVSFKQGPFFYLGKQLIGVVMAAGLCIIVSRIDLELSRRYVWVIGGLAILALILVLLPGLGITVKGSRRWLGIGSLRLQVSEFAKLAMVVCVAHYLASNQTRITEFRRGYLVPLLMIGAFAGLILLEPDFGTAALTVAVGLLMMFLAGARWAHVLPTVAMAAIGFAVMVMHNPNRLRRFVAFLDVEGNKQEGTYQLYQS
ncbi:MAG TPA: FtsW/RodA/SpoVE family cell cycle protein, partial [Opitutaceae bacterium]|nr:FtsW/RodA/SpoVE family cell cycle protein [Opitutaceae bacterium]